MAQEIKVKREPAKDGKVIKDDKVSVVGTGVSHIAKGAKLDLHPIQAEKLAAKGFVTIKK